MINWKVIGVDTAKVGEYLDAITMVRWVCKAVNGDKVAVWPGATALGAPSNTFIPYDKLTEEAVLGFCFDDGLQKSVIEAKVQDDLERALSAPDSPTLPWLKKED